MKKFILCLSNSRGHYFMLCADVEEKENVETIEKKIASELVIKDTYGKQAKDPKILQQLKKITGYKFVGLEPDLYLSFGSESFDLPGSPYGYYRYN